MAENRYFQKALSDFTYETASGGAIRHLTDSGYTVQQITEHLDYPTPYERVQKTVWEQLLARGVILRERPGSGLRKEKAVYVKEYDSYGKASFRRVIERADEDKVDWKERILYREERTAEKLVQVLGSLAAVNGKSDAYVSLDFGRMAGEPGRYEAALAVLPKRQREYVSGLPWEPKRVYHKLDTRIMEIVVCLYEAGQYRGECYFLGTGTVLELD